jgi:hypothetical protein
MRTAISILAWMCVLSAGAAALGDWNPGDPYKMHHPQLPDLSTNGMDVLNAAGLLSTGSAVWLADDWRCTQTGPVTDIHLWGSWYEDMVPENPSGTHGDFLLSIYSDVPAAISPTGYSMPGEYLWGVAFGPGSYGTRLYANAAEQFYDPVNQWLAGQDTQVWQYNFSIQPSDAFVQQQGQIYWLTVLNLDPDEDGRIGQSDIYAMYGWKTSRDNFNDAATFLLGESLMGMPVPPYPVPPAPGAPWGEMRYPMGHELEGQSIDLAFVITPEPGAVMLLAIGSVGLLLRRRGN